MSLEADCETERQCDMQEDSKGESELLYWGCSQGKAQVCW